MFFRRVFSKGSIHSSDDSPKNPSKKSNLKTVNSKNGTASPRRMARHSSSEEKQRGLSVLQLTPLWEHVVRTNSLPEEINIAEMFDEFLERLHDPEWQVRQHALRVLVDVSIVMGQKSDGYFTLLIKPLVDNLGHPAPAVRKGALDVLRVYVAQTSMPETIMLSIMNYGLDSTASDGRLTIGVMLALPSLLHPTLLATKRNFIIGSVLDALSKKMVDISYQELAVKILIRIKEMIGPREFNSYLTSAVRKDFESLCTTYNLPEAIMSKDSCNSDRPSSWAIRAAMKDSYIGSRNSTPQGTPRKSKPECARRIEIPEQNNNFGEECGDDNNNYSEVCGSPDDKIILEREIQISDDTAVTMRILETQSPTEESDNNEDDEDHAFKEIDTVLMRVLTDSELDEARDNLSDTEFLRRTPKRVHFGGEIVKMRTPDSDAVEHNDVETLSFLTSEPPDYENNQNLATPTPDSMDDRSLSPEIDFMKQLHIGIPSNAVMLVESGEVKEIVAPTKDDEIEITSRPKTTESIQSMPTLLASSPIFIEIPVISSMNSSTAASPKSNQASPSRGKLTHQRSKSASPKKRRRSSVAMSVLSPKPYYNPAHTPSQILYNLQKSPALSPTRSRKNSAFVLEGTEKRNTIKLAETAVQTSIDQTKPNENISTQTSVDQPTMDKLLPENNHPIIKTWEDLGIVDKSVLRHLKSGDWRIRSHAICKIEEALKSHDNLAKLQPHLHSLLRTLLSSEKHPDAYEDKKRVIINLISRLPLENLEDRVGQIITGLCRQGGTGSNIIAKALMQRLPTATIVSKLLSDDFLQSRSSKFRENALQMVLFALMTFPSTYFDIATCVSQTTKAANDRKKRVRQASLDVLAVLGQISSARTVMDVVQSTMKNRYESDNLIAAVKARLSRKQLPVVSQDGHVEYALRIPSNSTSPNYLFGADVEWIVAGSGSVSPTSMKNRWKRQSGLHVEGKFYDDTKRLTTEGSKHFGEKLSNEMGDMVENGVKTSFEHRLNHSTGWTHKSTNEKHQHHFLHSTTSGIPIKRHPSNVDLTTAPMYNKFQSRSYPELSESNKLPLRQFSDEKIVQYNNRHNLKTSKIPTPASSRFPMMEDKSDTRNGHYMTDPYTVDRKKVKSSVGKRFYRTHNDGFLSDSHGTPVNLSSHKELRPVTHPALDEEIIYHRDTRKKKSFADNFHNKNNYQVTNNYKETMDFRLIGDKYHQIDTNVQLETNHQLQQQQSQTITENGKTIIGRFSSTSNIKNIENNFCATVNDNNRSKVIQQMAYEHNNDSTTEDSQNASTDHSRNTSPEGEDDDEPDPITIVTMKNSESFQQLSQTQPSTPIRPKSVLSVKTVKSEDETDDHKSFSRPQTAASGRLIRTSSNSTFILDPTVKSSTETIAPNSIIKSRPTTAKPQSPFHHLHPPSPSAAEIDDVSSNSVESGTDEQEQEYENESKTSKSDFGSSQTLEIAESVTATPSPQPPQMFDDIPIEVHKSNENLAHVENFALQLEELPDQMLKSSNIKRNAKLMRTKNKVSPTGNARLPSLDRMKKPNELFPKSLRKVDKPRESLSNCLIQLESPSWDITMNGLQMFVRLIRHHPDVVDQQMHIVAIALAKHIKNLRSQVARAACQAAGEFFVTHNKTIEHEAEEISSILLNRTADTNKFLRNDATKALENMCDHMMPNKAIHILAFRGATHPNAVVRSNAAKLLARLVEQMGCEKVFALNRECREKLILTGANLLMEGSLDTRNYTKNMFKILSATPNYSKILLEIIPPNIYRNIEKTLKSIK